MSTHDFATYEEFGRKFFEVAVTEDRVADGFGSMAGDTFELGPFPAGPAGIARVTARVSIEQPVVTRRAGDMVAFDVRIPLDIDLLIDLRVDRSRFMVTGEIALIATARAAEPLLLIIDIPKPQRKDITVNVTSQTLRGELLRIVADVDSEIKRVIAKQVGRRIDAPEAQKAKVVDIGKRIASAWTGV